MVKKENEFDAIVIGSGLGGLSTAGLLAKVNKKRVLVLERHYEMGGLTHEFKRGPYSWDVGLHYVGNLEARFLDDMGHKMFDFLTNGKLKWNKMPEVFEKIIFPEFSIEIKETVKEYKKSLIEKFPEEKKAINHYIRDVHKIRLLYLCHFFSKFFYFPMKQIFSLLFNLSKKKALMTTKDYLDKYFKNDKLKTALSARWGNYGLPPNESAFAIHALIEHHYYSGGIFPDGGAEKIATEIEKTIEMFGGKLVVNREVTEILIKDNKAYGVKVKDLSSKNHAEFEYYAPIIISNAGAENTYLKLLNKNLNLPIQKELLQFHKGYSGLDLYIGLKDSPEKLGIKGENYWITEGFGLDLFKDKQNDLFEGKPCYLFLSFPSLKSGKHGGHTADIVTIVPYNFFDKWKSQYWKERDNSYYDLKEKLTESLINLVEKYIPGFKDLIVYKELATPLTFKHFTGRPNGVFYGLPATPERYKINNLNVKTPIQNLYLTGTDILCNGILPALFSGMATASYLNGPFGIMNVMSKVFSFNKKKIKKSSYEITNLNSPDKKIATLVKKTNTSDNLVELVYQFEEKQDFIPGQHIKLKVDESEWRAYSVAKITDDNLLTLVIDTRPKGYGANYARNIKIGEQSIFRLPLTDLIYHETSRDIIFIATGTGLIPFIHIMDEMRKMGIKKKISVIFGCMTEKDNFSDYYLDEFSNFFDITVNICIEKPSLPTGNFFRGRVTDFIQKQNYNPKEFDFYICGHPHMTESTAKLLRNIGCDKIYY